MDYIFKKATKADIKMLTETRIIVLRSANKLSEDVDMTKVEAESYKYYEKALSEDTHTAYLVFDKDKFIGAGGISYYTVMPTYHNPSGNKAYIMNMYMAEEYRRQGIAIKVLDLLVQDARERGIDFITLEATDIGKPLYKKYGFKEMKDEMAL